MSTTFGNRLKNIRTEKGIKREELASLIGTSSAIIGRYERNERTPSIDIAMNIAQALNVSLDFLAGDTSVLVKDKEVLQRIEDISNLSDDRKKYIYDFIDMCLRDYKTQKAYS
ncbi:helix-turn-helix domain-containing protein [Aquimarina mytili]|uniref:Helix-turn-helix transcriptional regulator n=1 Tax=Aquimarina mytili TaxID=874423 RepID=A0A937A7M3_9FLAO|nr:helix-turn-helix transcriptional regulator [Aquimarina mytili]MBL0685729.1 helix-turn-helix transcriptional regulator [Aquimarina mytili]